MKKIPYLFLPIVLFYSSAVLAEGFYAGAGIGMTQIEDAEDGFSFDDSAFGWRIYGGWEFNESIAAEAAYFNSGEAEDTIEGEKIEVELTGFTLSLLGMLPIGDNSRLFGKLGYFDGEAEASALGISVEDDDSGLLVGGGVLFDLENNLSIRGDLDWYDSEIDTVWSAGLSIQVLFGN